MNTLISLSAYDLMLASLLVLALVGLTVRLNLGIAQQLVIAAIRTTAQLLLIGLVLKQVFETAQLPLIALMMLVMLTVAAWEVLSRQKRKIKGWWGFGISGLSLFVSSFLITMIALFAIIKTDPWYTPQYAIPLLGMLLGNTMNGIALGMDRLIQTAWQQRAVIEQRLMLGQTAVEAIREIRHESMRAGMIPIINAMAAAGIVSLPGMMTGQILSGTEPVEAVKYQILIMFMVTAGTGFGVVAVLHLISKRMFDSRDRLRFDQLLAEKMQDFGQQ
ncbi:MAG: iron export ABC transporter permease subunit FetB [Gammaproteobacteria bacterium]|nr:iron export ABC transporter permease subunit FetB [Gammaproteobacteria bacterium]MCK5262685.1 iron export ABC transporter permease subunit FetB [Gammaproteobacteria bacterium]